MTPDRKPILTAAAVAIATIAAILQYAVPSIVPALQRDPGATGEWWRLVTPLLVQTLGWYQVAANLVTLLLVGVVAERELGRRRWALFAVAGTVGGQLAAYAWREPGGGDSIAICGLAGGLVIWLLTHPARPAATGVVACYVAALTGWGLAGIRGAAVACAVAAVACGIGRARRIVLLGSVGCAVVLALHRDLHGVSLLSGMLAALPAACLRKDRPAVDRLLAVDPGLAERTRGVRSASRSTTGEVRHRGRGRWA